MLKIVVGNLFVGYLEVGGCEVNGLIWRGVWSGIYFMDWFKVCDMKEIVIKLRCKKIVF